MIAEAIQKIEELNINRMLAKGHILLSADEFDIYANGNGGTVRIDKPRVVQSPNLADMESLVSWLGKTDGAVFVGVGAVRAVPGYRTEHNRIGNERIARSVGTLPLFESEAVTTLREFCSKGMPHETLATALNGPFFDRFPDAFHDSISEIEVCETANISLSRTRANTGSGRSVEVKCGPTATKIAEAYRFRAPLWKRLPYVVELDVRIQISTKGGLIFKGFAVGLEESIATARTNLAADIAKAVDPSPVYIGEPE